MTGRTSTTHPLRIDELAAANGWIGMTFCPGKSQAVALTGAWDRDLAADLDAIENWGARAVVSLIEPFELHELHVPELGNEVEARGMDWHLVPIPDRTVPDDRNEARLAYVCRRIYGELRAGGRVVFHCKGGLGRTGTLAARALIELHGHTADQAIAAVRAARADTVETAVQEQYLRCFEVGAAADSDDRTGRALACLLGGAVGDAFGYTVEFDQLSTIVARFGDGGLRAPVFENDQLIVSDDTQMTMFTAEGLIRARARGSSPTEQVHHAYLDWLSTQGFERPATGQPGWLASEKALRHRRAPGNTCVSALASGTAGTMVAPINDSKGCGGVMRIAPAAIARVDDADAAFQLGCELSALTHGHPSGYYSGGALALILSLLLNDATIHDAIADADTALASPADADETRTCLAGAVTLAATDRDPRDCINEIGEGWIGEEALAIGVYAALVADSFEDAVALASNHDGDSDSTASIAGQIYATAAGLACIPSAWVRRLDVLEPLVMLARDLARD